MVNKIIGRSKERQEHHEVFNSQSAEFVAVYGRLRIGKTYLIHNFFTNCKCTYFQTVGTQNHSMGVQLERFTNDLSKKFYNSEPIKPAKTWMEAFERLSKAMEFQNKNKKITASS